MSGSDRCRGSGDRHHPADGGDLGDERAVGGGDGHRGDNRIAGTAQARIRQGDDHRRGTGRLESGNSDAALGGAGALRHDRAPAGQPAVARGCVSWPSDGHDCSFSTLPCAARCSRILVRRFPRKSAMPMLLERAHCPDAGRLPAVHDLLPDERVVPEWAVTSLVESSAVGALASMAAAFIKGRMTWTVFEASVRQTLAITCMFMWIILAALCLRCGV
jgi:hypothetical protein